MQIILNRKLLLCIAFTAIVGSCTPVPAPASTLDAYNVCTKVVNVK